MSNIISLLQYEEGFSLKPYLCSEGYPTVGTGIRIGPKGADLKNYEFTVPREVDAVWLQSILNRTMRDMLSNERIAKAMNVLDAARTAVLVSMAYQMGVAGLAQFKNTLYLVETKQFEEAAKAMLDSKWAKQTPNRARRHAEQMRSGLWCTEYK
ncbi:lysozme [Aeromonas phage PS]|uniref:Lysozyme n=1 Tax=Aeromonas phage PS TaxID=2723762 RepID=A0A6H0X6Y1_9CAUD|nr:baseplate hub [Aeromonas phage PS]